MEQQIVEVIIIVGDKLLLLNVSVHITSNRCTRLITVAVICWNVLLHIHVHINIMFSVFSFSFHSSILQVAEGTYKHCMTSPDPIDDVCPLPHHRIALLTWNSHSIEVWNIDGGYLDVEMVGHSGNILSACELPSDRLATSSGYHSSLGATAPLAQRCPIQTLALPSCNSQIHFCCTLTTVWNVIIHPFDHRVAVLAHTIAKLLCVNSIDDHCKNIDIHD